MTDAGDVEPLKELARVMWSLGDYAELARQTQPDAEALADLCGIGPGMEVLDVAAGNGNFAVAAARRGARVVASDLTPRMLELGRRRTEAEGLLVEWQEADAEELPFHSARFDMVGSMFGAMFAPRPEVAASEMVRVTRPGGEVAMTAWTPDGFVGRLTETASGYAPIQSEMPSPVQWGREGTARDRLRAAGAEVRVERRSARFRFESIPAARTFFETNNGPLIALRNVLPPERYEEMMGRVEDLAAEFNRSPSDVDIAADYLVVLAHRP